MPGPQTGTLEAPSAQSHLQISIPKGKASIQPLYIVACQSIRFCPGSPNPGHDRGCETSWILPAMTSNLSTSIVGSRSTAITLSRLVLVLASSLYDVPRHQKYPTSLKLPSATAITDKIPLSDLSPSKHHTAGKPPQTLSKIHIERQTPCTSLAKILALARLLNYMARARTCSTGD